MATTFVKDPADVLDYTRDWTNQLVPRDDTIATSTWTAPTGITKDDETNDDLTSTVWLSGGTAGDTYEVPCTITTTGGRTLEQSIWIRVENR